MILFVTIDATALALSFAKRLVITSGGNPVIFDIMAANTPLAPSVAFIDVNVSFGIPDKLDASSIAKGLALSLANNSVVKSVGIVYKVLSKIKEL